jgi:hypothetical protein
MTNQVDNKITTSEERLHLKINELKEEKHSGTIIQSLVKLLSKKNSLIEELKKSVKYKPLSLNIKNKLETQNRVLILGELNQVEMSKEILRRV